MLDHECGRLWVVADGMGGHEDGAWASREIVIALRRFTASGSREDEIAIIEDAIERANNSISSRARKQRTVIGSTVVALHVHGPVFTAFWAGDSRAYLLRQGVIHQLTTDHTKVQEMFDAGRLTLEEMRNHPGAHVLSRAVGVRPDLKPDAVQDQIRSGDVFLLCSDGLTAVVSDSEIAERLKFPPSVAVRRLLELALSQGAPDNVTLIVVTCDAKTIPGLE